MRPNTILQWRGGGGGGGGGGGRQEKPDMFGRGSVQCCLSGHDDKVGRE